MIPFFRKIRYRLAKDNLFFKYSRYAVGEIALVVIGILIALQINNWNEKRKQNEIGRNALINLENEFIHNQILLNDAINWHEKTDSSAYKLLVLTGPTPTQFKVDSLDYYIWDIIYLPKFSPKKNVLNSLISSGDIHFIQNENIVQKITDWNGELDDYDYLISVNSKISVDLILPFLSMNFPLQNIKSSGIFEDWNDGISSDFDNNQNLVLTSMEFESLVGQRRHASKGLTLAAKRMKFIQTEILELINKELNR